MENIEREPVPEELRRARIDVELWLKASKNVNELLGALDDIERHDLMPSLDPICALLGANVPASQAQMLLMQSDLPTDHQLGAGVAEAVQTAQRNQKRRANYKLAEQAEEQAEGTLH